MSEKWSTFIGPPAEQVGVSRTEREKFSLIVAFTRNEMDLIADGDYDFDLFAFSSEASEDLSVWEEPS